MELINDTYSNFGMYKDGIVSLCFSCHPCLAVIFYDILVVYEYI